MDLLECCRKVEECLVLAARAQTREERLHWFETASAWIDRGKSQNTGRTGRRRQGSESQRFDC